VIADETDEHQTDDLACVRAVEIMTDYLEGAQTAAESGRLERHLQSCPGCIEYLRQLRAIAGSLTGLTSESFPAEIRDGLLAEFRILHHR
jgi:anti-sigma factor RsiW